jgi:alginate O-acetyltransferase complex protein AlgI
LAFNSTTFLFIFFPLFFAVYYSLNTRLKNYWTLAGSLLFYSWGSPIGLLVLLTTCIIDYAATIIISRSNSRSMRTCIAGFTIVLNICMLGYFKYINFIIAEFNKLIKSIELQPVSLTTVLFPIGISFFTFKKISYIIDRVRGTAAAPRSFADYLLYVSFFPQIMAGPIVKYHEMFDQIQRRAANIDLVYQGLFRFSVGLGKKVLIADVLGAIANRIFDFNPLSLPSGYAWLGAVCYTFQIYFDFSGYSDMAIGLGNMLGFTCEENFNVPYISRNITEFWRRWHISLSAWMREYLYIPLGGNRVTKVRVYLNLWIVFLVSGLWHGANWTFLVWGAYHGLFITLDKLFWQRVESRLNKTISITLAFIIITIGWVLFRSPDISFAIQYILRMLGMNKKIPDAGPLVWQELVTNRGLFILSLAAFFSFIPAFAFFKYIRSWLNNAVSENLRSAIKFAVMVIICLLSFMSLSTANFNAFIYFTF